MEKFRTYIKKHRPLITSIIILLILILVGVGAWAIYDIEENRRIDAEAVTLVEDLSVAYGKQAKVSDFLAQLNGELVDDFVIDTNNLGQAEITFEYINIKNKKRTRTFTIEIVDNTSPTIYGNNAYYVNVGYDGDLTNLMLSGDDLDDNPQREIVGEYDLAKVGTYDLEYIVTDRYNNVARKKFTLYVTQPTVAEEKPSVLAPKLPFAQVVKEHKNNQTQIGIDVSAWQGEIDWQKVKAAGVEFAMIRLGYQVDFGGEYALDKYFERNIAEAEKVGLPVGVYFYSYANSVDEARAQAEWIVEKLRHHKVALGVAFDWESWSEFNQAGMSFQTINQVAANFIDVIQDHGYRGWLYGSKVYLERIWGYSNYNNVWLAQYFDYATYNGDYQMWQLSNTGRVDGIDGDVDINVMYLDRDKMMTF